LSLNTGISESNGKWLKWFSPDDVLYPDCIKTLVDNVNDNTIVYSNWDIIDENSRLMRTFSESDYNSLKQFDFNVRLLDGQQINVNTTLIPMILFKKGCTIHSIKDPVGIDYDFFLNAALHFNVGFHLVKKSLIKYRIHSKQLSHKNIVETLSFIEKLRHEHLSRLDAKTRTKYNKELENYKKTKSISKKNNGSGITIGIKTSS